MGVGVAMGTGVPVGVGVVMKVGVPMGMEELKGTPGLSIGPGVEGVDGPSSGMGEPGLGNTVEIKLKSCKIRT